ncbi:9565_t:CDS:2 [Funneliformis mosseae]|uniref:9565_t:CDS:1 n=1 Tax=Funneliformis mosseae TaxID=27381 RepID=A0A9N9CAF0_FUNMO|nr:9565_t:CDS:2 [Funneliformis mosseae]
MSTTEINNSNADFNWLKRAISENYIKYYDFAEFTNWEEISYGSYGNVSCANWKACWKYDPNERPTMQQDTSILN